MTVPEDLQREMEKLIGQLRFMPIDFEEHPANAPEGMTNLQMYEEGFSQMLDAHETAVRNHPDLPKLYHIQQTLNTFAIGPFPIVEIAAFLSIAIDMLVRQHQTKGRALRRTTQWVTNE